MFEMVRVSLRHWVQAFFLALTLYGWYRLYLFVRHFDTGGATPYVPRPESVDAFLPIGALVALKNLVVNGAVDTTHPAALVLFLAIAGSAFLLRRGFCGWVCPVGAVSEGVSRVGAALGGNLSMPPWADRPLRVVKYLILAFFLKLVLLDMPAAAAREFLQSPYYKVVDAKLLDFWLSPGQLTLSFLLILLLLTLAFRNFWCRYLCPYGALLGVLASLGPSEVRRDTSKCTTCRRCSKVCPSGLQVHRKQRVRTPECMGCMSCVSACPQGALEMRVAGRRASESALAGLIVGILFASAIAARLGGYWESGVTYMENAYYIPLRAFISH